MPFQHRRAHPTATRLSFQKCLRLLPLLGALCAYSGPRVGSAARADSTPIGSDPRFLGPSPPGQGLFLAERADTFDVAGRVSPITLTLHVDGHPLKVPYYANRTLGTTYTDVNRAILVLHGTLRNADEYQAAVVQAGQMAGSAGDSTFIITPQFLTEPDLERHHLSNEHAFWAYLGWRKGDRSLHTLQNPRPAVMSSFTVADSILTRLVETLPNLQRIIIAGHSAGGQFANLLTAATEVHHEIEGTRGIPVRSIVSNPSSYLYFSAERWIEGTTYGFAVPPPEVIVQCPDYDAYKYGLQNPNEYASIGADSLRAHYSGREVVYLLGEADTNPQDYYLDTTCPAELMGSQRLERGIVYTNSLTHVFGPGIWDRQEVAIVPGVGHDHVGMFTSECGLYYLFDVGACSGSPPASAWQDVTPLLLRGLTSHAAAWGDEDGDGDPDLFLPATDDQDALLRNDGGTFADASHPPLGDPSRGMSAQWGDYDHDGRSDLYVVNWQGSNRLYHNDGGDLFSDATSGPLGITGDCTDAAWADYDLDGDLDLYVTRVNNQGCVLLRNDGSGFANISAAPINLSGNSRCPAWGDYDNDGDLDLFVARSGADKLFRNDGGLFTDVTSGPLADNGDGSSAAWADYDNDGDLDLYVVNRLSPNRLLRNDGGSFTSIQPTPVGVSGNGHSASWADYDNDGWIDLYLCQDGQPNRLFRNEGEAGFVDATEAPLDLSGASYSAAWADYDGDGDLDLYVTTNNGANHLLRNDAAGGRHWLQVALVGTESNVSAIGTRVRVLAGGQWQMRQVGGDSGYMAQNSSTVAFGLGTAALLDSVVIRWPSGIVQRIGGLMPDWRMTVVESELPMEVGPTGNPVFAIVAAPNPFGETTRLWCLEADRGGRPAGHGLVLAVFDASGRKVRELAGEPARGLPGIERPSVVWDGRDEAGRRVAAGVYLVRRMDAAAGAARIVRIR